MESAEDLFYMPSWKVEWLYMRFRNLWPFGDQG